MWVGTCAAVGVLRKKPDIVTGRRRVSPGNGQKLLFAEVAAAVARGYCLGKSDVCGVSTPNVSGVLHLHRTFLKMATMFETQLLSVPLKFVSRADSVRLLLQRVSRFNVPITYRYFSRCYHLHCYHAGFQ
jgi:hypothetical protein